MFRNGVVQRGELMDPVTKNAAFVAPAFRSPIPWKCWCAPKFSGSPPESGQLLPSTSLGDRRILVTSVQFCTR